MKFYVALSCAMSLLLFACSKKDTVVPNGNPPIADTTTKDTTKSLLLSGVLIPNPFESANGKVKVYKTGTVYSLVLEDFSSVNGPDLHVYLAQEATPVHFIDLGKLKSYSANQTYSINGAPDFSKYKFATIHCQQYDVVFGHTPLQ